MLRSSKKGDTSFNISTLNASLMSCETTPQTMERQIDNYTRRLQQDKRKFFRAQQNYSEIKKQFDNKNKELEKLKSKKHKSQLMTLKGKIGTLQASLDQTINSYNQALSKNNKLRCQIDELRKDKKNQHEKIRFLSQRVNQISTQIEERQRQIQQKKVNISKMKDQIIKVKQQNQTQIKVHQQEVHSIKQDFESIGKENERKQKDQKSNKTQNIDTQPILKLRLKNNIAKNKQKMKIIEQYKKHMHIIFQNFQEIKEESGIQELQEITKTFLKQEQQNLFIYQYMSRLNSTIQDLQESNNQIRQKIQCQQETNKQKRLLFSGTPDQVRRRKQFQQYKQQKSRKINELTQFLTEIKPKIMEIFYAYGLIERGAEMEVNGNNIEIYISQIQKLMQSSRLSHEITCKSEIKEEVTRYTRLPPNVMEDQKEKGDQKMLQKQKLNQIAGEYWEKKKCGKMISSKSNDGEN